MSTAILCLILAFLIFVSIRVYRKRLSSGCCGSGDTLRKKPVKDKDRSHYPFSASLGIDGMFCRNCAVHVENTLNELDGVWAKVDLDRHAASVLMKEEYSDKQLMHAVSEAGYTVSRIRREKAGTKPEET
ncbi:MAG: heavy-metal-associated domain-containing protein [Oscillospiraceae bacterium]|jgi:copper chaperone CopZ|nr:heavy-metal-associated domain-containing protein [Oscillospiraceae bacterium]MCI1990755.1 heavy-metal-associated domain-containing protein [Oscillospiraceae bacterium]MCI2035727.1 heavy-metal-associated domain-containing protein [Oscillospiraceae bacterium]